MPRLIDGSGIPKNVYVVFGLLFFASSAGFAYKVGVSPATKCDIGGGCLVVLLFGGGGTIAVGIMVLLEANCIGNEAFSSYSI